MFVARLLVVFAACSLGAIAQAAPMAPNAPDRIVYAWTFDGGTHEGWDDTNDIRKLTVEDGALCGQSDGVDASVGVHGLALPVSEITHVRVRMRSTEPGATQVYFATSEGPNPASNGTPHFACTGDNVFADYEVKLEGVTGWGGELRYFRVDPVNGSSTAARFEIDTITLLQRAPRPVLVDFHADKVWCAPGDPVTLRLVVENAGGGVLPIGPSSVFAKTLHADFRRRGGVRGESGVELVPWTSLDPNSTRPQYAAEWALDDLSETACFTAELSHGGEVLLAADTVVIAADGASLPGPSGGRMVGIRTDGVGVVEDEHVSLHIHGGRRGALWGLLRARTAKDGPWQTMGTIAPLVTIAVRHAAGGDQFTVPALEMAVSVNALELTAPAEAAGSAVHVAFSRGPKPGLIHFETTARAAEDVALLRLSGPRYLVGEGGFGDSKYTALFPGIEFLGPDDRSSDTGSTGKSLGFRHTPPPFQITVPVMAVSTGAMTTGILWDALRPWHGDEAMPMATFASPNLLQGQENHLMELFAPNWPVWTAKNARLANQPFSLKGGESVVLEGNLFARVKTDIVGAVPLWYEVYGKPEPPRLAKPLEETLGALMDGWVNTMYDPKQDAYTNHWRHGIALGPANWLKARVIAYGQLTGDWSLAAKMGLSETSSLREHLGSLFDAFPPPLPKEQLASQRTDGSWGYHCTEAVAKRTREFTNGERDSLGREGDTNAGLCASQALPILRYAVATGDPVAEAAGIKALAAMSDFRVPAGSQTWEVPMDAPDVYAASQVFDCYSLAYDLTHSQKISRPAKYWAYTGLPFLYSYTVPGGGADGKCVIPGDPLTEGPDYMEGTHPLDAVFENPDREVTPYGSIPVFGTSFYVVNWFGVLVQWCGLRWAGSVLQANSAIVDPVLLEAARGVVMSGCQQTFDKAPVEGCLPDAWHVETNTAYPAFIGPVVLEAPLRTLTGRPSYCDTRTSIVHGGGARAHISTRGVVEQPALVPGKLTWTECYLAGGGSEDFIAGLPKPGAVLADGKELPESTVVGTGRIGWQYDDETGFLRIRAKAADVDAADEPVAEVPMEVRFTPAGSVATGSP